MSFGLKAAESLQMSRLLEVQVFIRLLLGQGLLGVAGIVASGHRILGFDLRVGYALATRTCQTRSQGSGFGFGALNLKVHGLGFQAQANIPRERKSKEIRPEL